MANAIFAEVDQDAVFRRLAEIPDEASQASFLKDCAQDTESVRHTFARAMDAIVGETGVSVNDPASGSRKGEAPQFSLVSEVASHREHQPRANGFEGHWTLQPPMTPRPVVGALLDDEDALRAFLTFGPSAVQFAA